MNELIKKAIEAKPVVTFESYYKFGFYFSGKVEIDGKVYGIYARKGGNADTIYNLEITPTSSEELSEDFQDISLLYERQTVANWDNF